MNKEARKQIVEISLQFPNLRFGQFIDNACSTEYGYDSIHFPSDEILLELCINYVKKMKKENSI